MTPFKTLHTLNKGFESSKIKLFYETYYRPITLFTVFNAVISPCVYEYSAAVSKTLCDDLLTVFVNKISDIRLGISCPSYDPSISTVCKAEFQQFEQISLSHLQEIVGQLKLSGSSMDAIPPFILKQVFDAVCPYLLNIINRCLGTCMVLPEALKHAIIRPLLKKPNLDLNVLANFRPVSNLPFISKILEKTVLQQLLSFLEKE